MKDWKKILPKDVRPGNVIEVNKVTGQVRTVRPDPRAKTVEFNTDAGIIRVPVDEEVDVYR